MFGFDSAWKIRTYIMRTVAWCILCDKSTLSGKVALWALCFTLIIGGGRLGWAEDHDAFSLPTFQGAPKRRTLIRQLRDWYRTQRAGQRGLAKRLLKDLYELKQDLGIPNVLVAARALVVFGDQACRDKRWKHAVDYYREAIHFAPMVAGAHYRLGWSIWRENWHNWNRALSSFRRGFTLEWNEPLHRARRIEQLGLFVLCVVLLLWGVFWLGLFLRTLRLFEADFFQFFPVGVTLIQVRLLILILLSVPFFLGLGWIEILCCLLLTSWFYQKYTERLFSSLGLIVLSCIPLGLTYVIRARSVSRSIYLSSYVLSQTEGTKTNIKQVQKLLKKRRRDVRLLWSLGLYYKRQGKIEQARALFLRAKKQGPWPGIRLNLGNLDFLQQKSDTAFKTYRKLLNQTSVRTEVYYNLGQLFRHGKTTKLLQRGGEYRNAALFGPKAELVSQFNKNQKVQINRYLFDVLPPQRLFWHRLFHHPSQSDLSLWWMSFSSIIPLSWVGFVLLGLGLGLWLLLPFKHWICRSDVCDRCGLMSLMRLAEEEAQQEEVFSYTLVCRRCVLAFRDMAGDTSRKRIEKEFAVSRYQRRLRWFTWFCGVAFPGLGQLMQGRSLSAFLWMLITSCFVAFGVTWYAFGSPSLFVGSWNMPWLIPSMAIVALCFWATSLWSVSSHKRSKR